MFYSCYLLFFLHYIYIRLYLFLSKKCKILMGIDYICACFSFNTVVIIGQAFLLCDFTSSVEKQVHAWKICLLLICFIIPYTLQFNLVLLRGLWCRTQLTPTAILSHLKKLQWSIFDRKYIYSEVILSLKKNYELAVFFLHILIWIHIGWC